MGVVMKVKRTFSLFLTLGMIMTIQINCTNSPFGEVIAPEPRTIRGQVDLELDDLDDDVYVWLDGFKIDTRTDEFGFFTLKIPKELSESTSYLNGVYKLYLYVANYSVKTVDIAVRNGLFVYGKAGLNKQGALTGVVKMDKILDIVTIVEPQWARGDYEGPIDVQVTLQALRDSVTVIYPKSIGGLLGAILLKHIETQHVYVDIPDIGATTKAYDQIGKEPKSRRMVFQMNGINYRDLFLPPGAYEVIPFFLIDHENLPQELINTIGFGVEQIGANFLRIPYRRIGGDFRIIYYSSKTTT